MLNQQQADRLDEAGKRSNEMFKEMAKIITDDDSKVQDHVLSSMKLAKLIIDDLMFIAQEQANKSGSN